MFVRVLTLAALLTFHTIGALAAPADPIEGDWLTDKGFILRAAPCGGAYCIKVITGPDAGHDLGRVSGANGNYEGTIFDPSNGNEYDGTIELVGGELRIRGCVVFGIICQTSTLIRAE